MRISRVQTPTPLRQDALTVCMLVLIRSASVSANVCIYGDAWWLVDSHVAHMFALFMLRGVAGAAPLSIFRNAGKIFLVTGSVRSQTKPYCVTARARGALLESSVGHVRANVQNPLMPRARTHRHAVLILRIRVPGAKKQ